MRRSLPVYLVTLSTVMLLVLATASGAGPGFQFVSIDFPGATLTRSTGINSEGQIVGRYVAGGTFHAFLLTQGTYSSIDVPGASFTIAHGINDDGQIVGRYGDAHGIHGFLLSEGAFTTINFPGAIYTALPQINSRGEVAGTYIDPGGAQHGFSLDGDSFRSIDFPGASFTEAIGINSRGEITGVYSFVTKIETANDNHGFVFKDGAFTSFDVPDATTTFGWKVNDHGQIVGCWTDANGVVRGFLRNREGSFATVDFPGTTYSYSSAIPMQSWALTSMPAAKHTGILQPEGIPRRTRMKKTYASGRLATDGSMGSICLAPHTNSAEIAGV